jgi:hypothetical protein
VVAQLVGSNVELSSIELVSSEHIFGPIAIRQLIPIIYFLSSAHYGANEYFVKSFKPFCCLSLSIMALFCCCPSLKKSPYPVVGGFLSFFMKEW